MTGTHSQTATHSHLRDHLSARRERALFTALGFAVAITAARVATKVLHDHDAGSSGGLVVDGIHLHHYMFGLAIVLAVAFLWMQEVGIGEGRTRASRITAVLFGVGVALVLDEFALLLNLRDVYWQERGRTSIEALGIFGGILLIAATGHPFGRARWRERRGAK